MIIVTKHGVTQEELDHIRERVESFGLRTHVVVGEHRTVIACVGDEERIQNIPLRSIPGVEAVQPVMRPYKLASRDFSAEPSRIPLGSAEIGGSELVVIAGPCSVEGKDMLERQPKKFAPTELEPFAGAPSNPAVHHTHSRASVKKDSKYLPRYVPRRAYRS